MNSVPQPADDSQDRAATPAPPAVEPGEFYMEDGCMVFTAQYHLRRGFCCGSGCRHCPY